MQLRPQDEPGEQPEQAENCYRDDSNDDQLRNSDFIHGVSLIIRFRVRDVGVLIDLFPGPHAYCPIAPGPQPQTPQAACGATAGRAQMRLVRRRLLQPGVGRRPMRRVPRPGSSAVGLRERSGQTSAVFSLQRFGQVPGMLRLGNRGGPVWRERRRNDGGRRCVVGRRLDP